MKRDNSDHPWRTGKRPVGAPRGCSASAEVPTAKLRKAFEKSGLTKTAVAMRLGWTRADIQKLNRALGYLPDNTRGKRRDRPRELMSYELATKLCEAMNASPFECGI